MDGCSAKFEKADLFPPEGNDRLPMRHQPLNRVDSN